MNAGPVTLEMLATKLDELLEIARRGSARFLTVQGAAEHTCLSSASIRHLLSAGRLTALCRSARPRSDRPAATRFGCPVGHAKAQKGKGYSMKVNAFTHSAADVKAAAKGRWPEILSNVAGIDAALLDGRGHPCPKCEGDDRFSLVDADAGAVLCRKCFFKKNGDGLAAVCWARGCDLPAAIKAVADYLWLDSSPNGKPKAGPVHRNPATYDYRNEAGELLLQVVRYEPKIFKQRRPKPDGGWVWSVKGVPVVPYLLPRLLAEPQRPVFVVEGEKDADSLAGIGVLATCNAGGAGKWTVEHAEFLRGRNVVIVPDNDDAGRNHAAQVVQSLHGIAASVRVVELPDLPPKGDVSDWINAGGTKEDLKQLANASPVVTPAGEPWPELESFGATILPGFPTHALPAVLREWVDAESQATQTPADLAGLLALAVCAACIARRVVVEPRPGCASKSTCTSRCCWTRAIASPLYLPTPRNHCAS